MHNVVIKYVSVLLVKYVRRNLRYAKTIVKARVSCKARSPWHHYFNCYTGNVGAAFQQCVPYSKHVAITVLLFECDGLGHLATTTYTLHVPWMFG